MTFIAKVTSLILIAVSLAGCGTGQLFGPGGWVGPVLGPATVSKSFNVGGTIQFGSSPASYYVTQMPVKVGQTLTMTYTLSGNLASLQQNPNPGSGQLPDVNPVTISFLLMQKNDNESCQGDYNFYRMFGRSSYKQKLYAGTNTISIPISGAAWQGCFPANVVTDARLQTLLNNLYGIGFAFGGANNDGHGVVCSSNCPSFTINSFTVK
jgi:hypothetical protein